MRTDHAGQLRVEGFLGDHRLIAGAGCEAGFSLEEPGQVTVEVTLPAL
jgi:hypothetical protein